MANVKRSVEMLVLGLITDKPSHAYELKGSIDAAVGHVHGVSDGMLYPLLRELTERGYISGTIESGVNAPDKRVYHLEEQGAARLRELLASPLESNSHSDTFDFFARYALFKMVGSGGRAKVLRERLAVCDRSLARLADTALITIDAYRLAVIDRLVAEIESECEWLIKSIAGEGIQH